MEVIPDNVPSKEGRRGSGERRQAIREGERRTERIERRHEFKKRKAVALLHQGRLNRAADVVKTTKLVEPAWLIFTAMLSAMASQKSMGDAGPGFIVALFFHEMGHYLQTKKEGYRPQMFWFVPLLGAVMSLPKMKERIHVARIAYAGPLAGLVFTIAMTIVWFSLLFVSLPPQLKGLDQQVFMTALASLILNMFNLIPIAPLDGGRITSAMSGRWPERMRVLGVALLLTMTALTPSATMMVVWILVIGSWSFRRRKTDGAVPIGRFMGLFDRVFDAVAYGLRIAGEKAVCRLPSEYQPYRFWRFFVSYLIIVVVLHLLLRATYVSLGELDRESVWQLLRGVWTLFWEKKFSILGELIFTGFGMYFVHVYYLQWKLPHVYHPVHEQRGKRVSPFDAAKMTRAYPLLVGAFVVVGAILYFLYYFFGPTTISWS